MIKQLVILPVAAILLLSSCTISRVYPKEYYEQHKTTLHQTESLFKQVTQRRSLAIAFTDLDFSDISLELKNDTIRYIYEFTAGEPRMNDSLYKFGYDSTQVNTIVKNMQAMRSTWINTLGYNIGGTERRLIFISAPVKQFTLFPLLQKRKYYLYHFYTQPQYYDEQGRLLDRRRLRRLRKVNNEIFWRINDKVCYTISGKFR
jgi:hypothetical protein